jgi:hypothetical protein
MGRGNRRWGREGGWRAEGREISLVEGETSRGFTCMHRKKVCGMFGYMKIFPTFAVHKENLSSI